MPGREENTTPFSHVTFRARLAQRPPHRDPEFMGEPFHEVGIFTLARKNRAFVISLGNPTSELAMWMQSPEVPHDPLNPYSRLLEGLNSEVATNFNKTHKLDAFVLQEATGLHHLFLKDVFDTESVIQGIANGQRPLWADLAQRYSLDTVIAYFKVGEANGDGRFRQWLRMGIVYENEKKPTLTYDDKRAFLWTARNLELSAEDMESVWCIARADKRAGRELNYGIIVDQVLGRNLP